VTSRGQEVPRSARGPARVLVPCRLGSAGAILPLVSPSLQRWVALRTYLSEDFLGGPKALKLSWVINFQKGGTLPFVLALMWATDTWTATAWTYLAMHGSYGLIWLLKDRVMPDPRWETPITFGGAFMAFALVLGPYWIAPVLLVVDDTQQPAWLLAAAAMAYAVGVVVMMASDAQKHFTLKVRRGLITTGFFARVRHPNYLGEMVLYAAFAVVAGHWIPWLVLAWVWLGLFLPNMLGKEDSMSRYPEWAAYRARTGMLLPRLRPARDAATVSGAASAGSVAAGATVPEDSMR
jgi:protein-S-isoprenylcysteine O-methyltransferase Ste14